MRTLPAPVLLAQYRDDREAILAGSRHHLLGSMIDWDLTLPQLRIVLLVAMEEATTGAELAHRLHVTPATVSSSVDRLVGLGYLVREEAASDRRLKRLRVTEKGAALQAQVLDLKVASDEVLSQLSHDDLAALVQGTAALRRVLEASLPHD